MKLLVFGAGKVGRCLSAALRRAPGPTNYQVQLRGERQGWPTRCDAEVVLLCVRDNRIEPAANQLAGLGWSRGVRVVLHVSGALSPEVLGVLRERAASSHEASGRPGQAPSRGTKRRVVPGPIGVGQLHPMLSFASPRHPPVLVGAHALVSGDAAAVRVAKQLARRAGLVPREWQGIDPALYHAAAALVANGAVALVAAGAELLRQSGADPKLSAQVLGPLLRSVADNVLSVGVPEALTGPVRRGAGQVIQGHLKALRGSAPELRELYVSVAAAQLPLAAALGDASVNDLKQIQRLLQNEVGVRPTARRGRSARRQRAQR